jgi:very-short-patch-repair endonuclease
MLEATGYLVFRFSECEIRENVDALAVRVAMAVKSRRH